MHIILNNTKNIIEGLMKNRYLLLFLIIFFVISILSIYSSTFILSNDYSNIYIKQIIWYIISFVIILILSKKKKGFFYKYDKILCILGIISLVLVLIFGVNINGTRGWFNIFGISIQPSEFMKIFLIIILSTTLSKNNPKERSFKSEICLIGKCTLLTLIPFILTFLEPDTGNSIIYIIILITMLFIYGIRYRWYFISLVIITVVLLCFSYLYIYKQDTFIDIFSTKLFYRIDRITSWKNNEGMQLNNALAATGSTEIMGYGIGKTPIYFPEAETDFIASIIFSNFGFIISIIFLIILFLFDICLLRICLYMKKRNKYLVSGILSILIFSQIQNIGMNLGLLPITGITLPFISYGGSSLLTYMILIGLILNINKKTNYYS